MAIGIPSVVTSPTILNWNGSTLHNTCGAGSSPCVGVTIAATAPGQIADVDFDGIEVKCNNGLDVGVEMVSVAKSKGNFGASNCLEADVYLTTASSGNGFQDNDFNITAYHSSGATCNGHTCGPTEILMDGQGSGGGNISLTRFRSLTASHLTGDGIVIGNVDNMSIDEENVNGTNATGNDFIIANPSYSQACNGTFYGCVAMSGNVSNRIPHDAEISIRKTHSLVQVQGFQGGAVAATGVHVGTGALETVQGQTSGADGSAETYTLTFSSFATVGGSSVTPQTGMVANCSATGYGANSVTATSFPANNPVVSVSSLTVTFANQFGGQGTTAGAVPSGTYCQFTWGFTNKAAYKNASSPLYRHLFRVNELEYHRAHWGHTQASVAQVTAGSGGYVIFTDMTFLFYGTPSTNDTFTFQPSEPTTGVAVLGVDANNTRPLASFEAGSGGITGYTGQGFYLVVNPSVGNTNQTQTLSSEQIQVANGVVYIDDDGGPQQAGVRIASGAGAVGAVVIGSGNGSVTTSGTENINVNTNKATNINTGTSNGNVHIDDGTGNGTVSIGNPNSSLLVGGTGTSGANWQTTSPAFNLPALTLNDTTASGTVPADYAYTIQAPTFTSTGGASTTITNVGTLYVPAPACSGGVICSNLSAIKTPGLITGNLGLIANGANISLNASSNFTTNINTGTSSGTVSIGSGSGNNAINIGNGTGKVSIGGPLQSSGDTQFSVASGTGACATSEHTAWRTCRRGILCVPAALGHQRPRLRLIADDHGYSCWGRDVTTPTTVTQNRISLNNISVTLTLTSVTANDVIQFGCLGY